MALRTTPQSGSGAAGGGASGSGSYTASVPALTTAASTVEQTRDKMSSQVNALLNALDGLSTASWAGPARGAYNSAQQQWVGTHKRLMRALDDIADGLRVSGRSYEHTESANTGDINRAASGLDH